MMLQTIRLSEDRNSLIILDQTLLPGETHYLHLQTAEEIHEAIYKLRVRGAPAIGVTAGYALALLGSRLQEDSKDSFLTALRKEKDYLASARPTAYNLFWALARIEESAKKKLTEDPENIEAAREAMMEEAFAIHREDEDICTRIGEIGFSLLKKGDGILTHCNAGRLATSGSGTATAPMYAALAHGWGREDFCVYCDETRPLLQGARLTAYELSSAGIRTTLQCDNMVSSLMAEGRIQIVFVGCDRVAANGDAANKIGTSGVAILARHYGIPFYVCAPSSTIDLSTPTGREIHIEQRPGEEVTDMWYKERMAPQDIEVYNPAFDVTPHELITGIITEKGLVKAPFEEAFRSLF
ncbi:MAG: S-methyl-5-thioribose-1-phosphate isomerase [Lachnospiraceae bacterium]|nr:S-methyl-5-thioribose-1-phosphate isomerase [Lachnospiraceae bacterium]